MQPKSHGFDVSTVFDVVAGLFALVWQPNLHTVDACMQRVYGRDRVEAVWSCVPQNPWLVATFRIA